MQSKIGTKVQIVRTSRLLSYLRPYRGKMVVASVAVLVSMAMGLTFPILMGRLFESVNHSNKDTSALNYYALLLGAVFLTQAMFSLLDSYLLAVVGEHVVYDLRTELYRHLQSLSLDFFAGRNVGELISRINSDLGQVRYLLTTTLTSSMSQCFTFVGAIIIVVIISPRMTGFTVAVMPVVGVLTVVLGRRLKRYSATLQDRIAASSIVAEESLQGIRIVKSFCREEYEFRRFADASQITLGAAVDQALHRSLFSASMTFLGFASLSAIMWFGAHEVISGRFSMPMITSFLIYGVLIATSLGGLTGLYAQLQTTLGAAQSVFEILDSEPSVQDSPGATLLPTVHGRITFENVSFAYEETGDVLHGVSIDIAQGEILALVGPSGAGKTTMLNLILRFYDPLLGRILLDGVDVRAVTLESLRGHIAMVPQDSFIFRGTIRDNILYGKLTASESELISAAEAANAHDFIMNMANGYDTIVGERGAKLSGGERQRLAIARAILKNPRVLLLDEATSSLDNLSECAVQVALGRLMKQRTTVIIAHRLSTVRAANRIAVVDRGQITELGSHDELIRLNGLYTRFYAAHLREPNVASSVLSQLGKQIIRTPQFPISCDEI